MNNKITVTVNEVQNKLLTIQEIIDKGGIVDRDLHAVVEILEKISIVQLDDIIHKLDTHAKLSNLTIEDRIREYRNQKIILEPFLPALLLYSMYINNIYR